MYTQYNMFYPELPKAQTDTETEVKDKVGDIIEHNGKKYKVIGINETSGKPKLKLLDEKELRFVQYQDEKLKPALEKGWTVRKSKTPYDPYGTQTYDPKSGGYTYNKQPLDWNDFKERHKELIETELGVPYDEWEKQVKSPNKATREAATLKFQQGYNKWYKEATEEDYFSGDTEKLPYGKDSKPGIYTTSAPGLSKPKTPATVTTTEGGKNTAQQITTGIPGPPGDIPEVGWFPQDVNNLYGALADWTGTKKYMPWMPQADFQYYDPTFYDPSRALANINEQTNIGVQGLNAYGSPQGYTAGYNQMQGKAAEQAANTLGQYENLNVGIANDAAKYNAEVDTKQALYNAQKTGNYYDQVTIANQQKDNADKQNRRNAITAFNTGMANSAMANNINFMNPNEYFMDPRTGRIRFNKNNVPSNLDDTYKADAQRREEQLAKFLGDDKWKGYDNDAKFEIYDRLYPSEFSPGSYRKPKGTNPQQDDMYMRMMQMMMGSGAYPFG